MSTGPQARGTTVEVMPGTVFDDDSAEVARSYAEALLNVVTRDGQADAVLDELDEFRADLIDGDPRFGRWLASPSVPGEAKDRALRAALEGRASPILLTFLRVLNRRGRLDLIGPVAAQARAGWDRRQNRRHVAVRSAVPLDDGQQAALRDRLSGLLGGATPVLHFAVDPDLLGGLVVQVGDEVYDASVRARLAQMRRRLAEGLARDAKARFVSS